MALGTASTGTAIGSLSGVAATNATLAAIGGGSIASGGGGMALGATVLEGATLGVGLLVGGIIFNIVGSSLSDKADEAWSQMEKSEKEINKICNYFKELFNTALKFNSALSRTNKIYVRHFIRLRTIVEANNKVDWNDFTAEERVLIQNTVLLVNLLYGMCKINLVLATGNESDINKVNYTEINKAIGSVKKSL